MSMPFALDPEGAFPLGLKIGRRSSDLALLDFTGAVCAGLSPLTIIEGTVGSRARAIGGACLPLLANFARDREVLFKESA
jgi:hypothetical protein